MKRLARKIGNVLRLPAGVGGAFLGLAVFQLGAGNNRLAGLVVGWLYGVSVWGLMRGLSVPAGWSWLAGFFAGPVPIALLLPGDTPSDDRGVIVLGCVFGCLLGLLETAHARRGEAAEKAADPPT
jgi:hypothetical protein